jgi:hypothetical protein
MIFPWNTDGLWWILAMFVCFTGCVDLSPIKITPAKLSAPRMGSRGCEWCLGWWNKRLTPSKCMTSVAETTYSETTCPDSPVDEHDKLQTATWKYTNFWFYALTSFWNRSEWSRRKKLRYWTQKLDLDVISSTGLGLTRGIHEPNYFKRLGKQKGKRVVIHNQVNVSSLMKSSVLFWPSGLFNLSGREESIPVRCTSCWVIHFPTTQFSATGHLLLASA